MPKVRRRKETSFQNTVTRSVFLFGKPNTGKRSILEHMVSAFTELVNWDIRILDSTRGIFLQLVKNDKKNTEMRKLEKTLRVPGYNSAFCQNAFDQAVTHLSNRLEAIRTEMIPMFGIFARSKSPVRHVRIRAVRRGCFCSTRLHVQDGLISKGSVTGRPRIMKKMLGYL